MAISVGSVEVDIIPTTQGIYQRLKGELVTAATRAGEDAGRAAGRAFGPAMSGSISDAVGERIGLQIGRQIAGRITASIRDSLRDGVTQGGAAARPAATRQGEQTGSAFARSLRARLEAGMRNLPEIRLTADSSDAEREIYQIRFQLQTLQDSRIGIDISAAGAVAEIERLQVRLERLSASDADVAIRVDSAAAAGELAAVQAMVNRLDGQDADVNVRVDTSGALASIAVLTVALAGVAAIPAIPVLAAGIGSIAAAGVAAGAGVGALAAVAVPAFKDIGGALQAQKAAQDAATTSTGQGGAAASQAASKALQQAGAQQALAAAHRNAARQIAQAQQAVADAARTGGQQVQQAEESAADAVRRAAEANRTAAQQVTQAKQAVTAAVQQAADQQRDAAERVTQAERSLADAQATARQAQLDLTQARKDAAAELAEMGDRLSDAKLSERDATLGVQEAQLRLRATQAVGSKATLLEQQRAQLAYDQAVQRLKEQQDETSSLTAEKKAADKAGVEGSDTVKAAQDRLAAAQRGVGDQAKALAKAQQDAARQQIDGTAAIAAAQQKVSEAQRNAAQTQADGARTVAKAQRDVTRAAEESAQGVARAQQALATARQSAADSIASAERQVASASMSSVGATSQAASAQDKYAAALAKLSPAARATFNAIGNLKTAFTAWSKSLQPQVMPIFTRAINGLRRSLPGLTPFVLAAADAISGLQDRVSRGFKSPWWKSFRTDLAGSVGPAITGLGVSFGNVFKTLGGIIDAFLPHMDSISATMQRITGRWATWAAGLKGSPEFERFLAYAARMGPTLATSLGDISSAFYQVSKSLAPLSGPVLSILGALARGVASIATNLPWLVQGIYLVLIATRLWTLAMVAFNLVMNANPITLIIIGIVALVAAVIYAYKNWAWFRTVVQAAWAGIQTAAVFVWNTVLKPIFNATWAAIQLVGRVAMWLWTNAIQPAWNGIAAVAQWLWGTVLRPVFDAISAAVRVVGRVFSWLYRTIIKPVFNLVVGVIRFWWKVMGAIFETAVAFVRNVLGPIFRWLYDKVIKPVWNGIKAATSIWWRGTKAILGAVKNYLKSTFGPAFTWLRDKVIKPVWAGIKTAISTVYTRGIKPIFERLKTAVKSIGVAFDLARRAIKIAWDKLKGIAKAPVNFIINTVYTRGIKRVWDKVVGAFGGKALPKISPLATGGVLPGYTPGRDVHLAALSGGEAVMRPEWTRAVGPGYVDSMNSAARGGGVQGVQKALGLPGFSLGGIFKGIGSLASSAWNKAKQGASWLKDTFGAAVRAGATKVINPLISKIPGDAGLSGVLKDLGHKAVTRLIGAGKKADEEAPSGLGGKIPAGRHKAIITQALAAAHVPPPGTMGQWLTGMNTLITRESGWNAGAVNRWDSNAAAGHASQGLAQTIPGTFNAYVPKSLKRRGILDPVANVAAAIRYIVSRYGNITKVQQANASRPPAGYDSGGYLQPGLNLAYNGTGRPEPVFTRQQASALMNRGAGAGTSGPASFEGSLYLDSGEFLGRVRGEAEHVMKQGQQQLVSAIRAS